MKIICVGRNYGLHAKELGNAIPEEPVIFMKPDTALLRKNEPFFIPDFSTDVHHEVEIVLRINRLGKSIAENFAHKYFNEITLGVDFTARDLQTTQKEKGLPWEIAKAFDHSAVIGELIPIEGLDINNLEFSLVKNGNVVQKGNAADMIFNYAKIISYVSKFFTLKIGDLIYTGTPAGVGAVAINDRLEGYIGEKKIFDFKVK